MLFDSVYRKNGNYYPEMLLEKFGQSFFFETYNKFWFLGLWKYLLKYKKVPFPEIQFPDIF